MARRRVLAIGLDGFDVEFADQLIASGDLPTFARVPRSQRAVSPGSRSRRPHRARVGALRFGPDAGGRRSGGGREARSLDLRGVAGAAPFEPFFQQLDVPCVVFDAPYFDLGARRRFAASWRGARTTPASRQRRIRARCSPTATSRHTRYRRRCTEAPGRRSPDQRDGCRARPRARGACEAASWLLGKLIRRLGARGRRHRRAALRRRGVLARDRCRPPVAQRGVGRRRGQQHDRGLPRATTVRRRRRRRRGADRSSCSRWAAWGQPVRRPEHGVAPRAPAPLGVPRVAARGAAGVVEPPGDRAHPAR